MKNKVHIFRIAFYLCLALWAANKSQANVDVLKDTGTAFSLIAQKALPAVVFINVQTEVEVPYYNYSPFHQFFGYEQGGEHAPASKQYQEGQGSGFIISKDGYILTNNHVVNNADRITVTMDNGKEYIAKLIGTDPKSEVALIKINDDIEFSFLPLGDSDSIKVGEWVLAAGNPFGLSQTITAGIISAKGRNNLGITEYGSLIQTDAAINPGNSGGPMLNIEGEVIGMNTAIYSRSGGYMGVGFAVPINLAKQIKDQLLDHGKVLRSFLGIGGADVTEDMASFFGLHEASGIIVNQVIEDSAAEEAGLKRGDVILVLNGWEITSYADFRNQIASQAPGTTLKMDLLRDGKKMSIEAITRSMDGDSLVNASGGESVASDLGIKIAGIDAQTAQKLGLDKQNGVLIKHVEQGSAAWRTGLRPGLIITGVNRKPIHSVSEFNKALRNLDNKEKVLLFISDGQSERFVVVPLK